MDSGVGQITVHPVNFGKVMASAFGAYIHFQLLVAAVVAVSQGKIYAFVKAFFP